MPVKSESRMCMSASFTSVDKMPLKESQFLDRLHKPMSLELVKQFSTRGSASNIETKTSVFKVKKNESIETKSTDFNLMDSEEEKFVKCYKNDLVFRKRVDVAIKLHEKRMRQKQGNISISEPCKSICSITWKTQKQKEETNLVDLYEKCKLWIQKVNEEE